MRSLLAVLCLSCLGTPMLLAGPGESEALEGYFFPPSRALYFFRPDLYVYRVAPPAYQHYRYPRFRFPEGRYVRPSRLWYPVSDYFGYSAQRWAAASGIYRVVLEPPPTGGVVRVNTSDIIFAVKPPSAQVYVDDRLIGSARDFATERDRYTILDGEHSLRIEYPGYQTFESVLQVVPDRTLHLDIELKPAEQ